MEFSEGQWCNNLHLLPFLINGLLLYKFRRKKQRKDVFSLYNLKFLCVIEIFIDDTSYGTEVKISK